MTLQEASSYLHAVTGTALFVWLYLENAKTILVSGMGYKAGILSVNLYKKYTSLKSRELEELPRFQVMSWQPFQLP